MAHITAAEKNTHQRAIATIKLRNDIAKKRLTEADFHSLISTLSPTNDAITYRSIFNTVQDLNGADKLTPGFELTVPLSNAASARIIKLCLQANMVYEPIRASFNIVEQEGKSSLVMRTEGHFFARHFRSPVYSIAVNMEKFARYALFREMNVILAKAQIYQYDASVDFMPKLPVIRQTNADMVNFTPKQLEQVYFGHNKETQQIIKEHSTVLDTIEFSRSFKEEHNKYIPLMKNAKVIAQKMAAPEQDQIGQGLGHAIPKTDHK